MRPDSAAPIGIFDSGLGGLAVYQAVRRSLPRENIIHLADSGFAPYGDRDAAFVEARTCEMARQLVDAGVKALVIACNTAAVVAAEKLRGLYEIPIVALEPAIKPAVAITESKVIGVLATHRTLASVAVARLCRLHGEGMNIILQPCRGLVEQVEKGEMQSARTFELLRQFIDPLLQAGADTLVLGCTHYIFLTRQIRSLVGPQVRIVESSAAVARQLVRRLKESRTLCDINPDPREEFFTTATSMVQAGAVASQLLERLVEVRHVGQRSLKCSA